jgi:hypothetical protein
LSTQSESLACVSCCLDKLCENISRNLRWSWERGSEPRSGSFTVELGGMNGFPLCLSVMGLEMLPGMSFLSRLSTILSVAETNNRHTSEGYLVCLYEAEDGEKAFS